MPDTFERLMNGADGGLAFQVLAENSFDSILITDASTEGTIIYANQAFAKLTGHDPSSVIGKTPRIPQGPRTDEKVIARISNAMKSGGKPPASEQLPHGQDRNLWERGYQAVARYGQAYKDRIVARLLPPESSVVEVVSREVGVSVATLERWRAEALASGAGELRGGGGQRWTAAARLEAVIATAAMKAVFHDGEDV